jgi:hypothetical protein
MSLEVRCTCGWCCQASEFYLGDRIECPECGAKVAVNKRSDIPYGYAPYPTWQKKVPVRMPRTRSAALFTAEDPHAASALWLGIFAVVAALTGCGGVIAIVLAVFGVREALRSNAFNRRVARPVQARARAALVLSSIAVLLAGVSFFSLISESSHPTNCRRTPRVSVPQVEVQDETPPYRYQYTEAELRQHVYVDAHAQALCHLYQRPDCIHHPAHFAKAPGLDHHLAAMTAPQFRDRRVERACHGVDGSREAAREVVGSGGDFLGLRVGLRCVLAFNGDQHHS